MIPALFTRMSMAPRARSKAAKASRTDADFETSQSRASDPGVLALHSAATDRQIARPRPEPAPVTKTFLFVSFIDGEVLWGVLFRRARPDAPRRDCNSTARSG